MSESRYLKVTITAAVGVYLPFDSAVDRAASQEALQARLQDAADWSSDGRKNLSVEMFKSAAETIVRNSIERLVDDYLRSGKIQEWIQAGGPSGRRAHEKLERDFAVAMSRVSIGETPVSDEHELMFEIEDGR